MLKQWQNEPKLDGVACVGTVRFFDWNNDENYDHVTTSVENGKEVHPSQNQGEIKKITGRCLDNLPY
ncbi:hypothetical protein [Spirochaeta cellobiosiphila]|uniref:hypothetical protein n=1 Tax=Spirochaeta cellobiosiphila TaxID=504483 RepID=UPI0004051693|nr:hypothetical protein [Spirochaeta cellobiosiphila]